MDLLSSQKAKKSNCNLLLLGLKATNVKLYAIIPLVRTVNWFFVALDQRVLHKIVLYFVYGSEEQIELLLLGHLIWTCYLAKKPKSQIVIYYC